METKEKPKHLFNPISLGELVDREFADQDWVVERLIPVGAITMISAPPGSYKTWFLLRTAIAVARGDILFGNYLTKKTGVLIINEEDNQKSLKDRALMLETREAIKDITDKPIELLSMASFKLIPEHTQDILKLCQERGYGMVVIDTFRDTLIGDENNSQTAAEAFGALKILKKAGIAVVLTHHHRKEGVINVGSRLEAIRGSSAIGGSLDVHIQIAPKAGGYLVIEQSKCKMDFPVQPFQLQTHFTDGPEGKAMSFEYVGEHTEEKGKVEIASEIILKVLGEIPGPTHAELKRIMRQKALDISSDTVTKAIRALKEGGLVEESKGQGNSKVLFLKQVEDQVLEAVELPVS